MSTDRVNVPEVWRLDWTDVDPATCPAFDPAGVHDLVRALPAAAEIPPAGADWRLVEFWYDRMTEALAGHLGTWVAGWGYTVTVEDFHDRGVMPVWRTERPAVTTPDETLARVADAVVAWHERLVGLGGPAAWQAVRGTGRYAVPSPPHPRRLPHPSRLSWADTAPPVRGFDAATVPPVVDDLLARFAIPSPGADWRLVDLWQENVSVGLVDRYGSWAVGWRWSVGEGDLDGGPVGAWCCFRHSVTTPEATAAAISAAVVEWRDWLDDVAERFDRFMPLAPGDLDGWERAVAHLVTAVGDRTCYESGWYTCCLTVLGWFLDRAGIGPDRRTELLDHAVSGRFDSWAEPSRELVESVAADLSRRVAGDSA